ncbi:LuxR C-terminal-related transcriptional regulator [Streptomyces sp. NPDC003691]
MPGRELVEFAAGVGSDAGMLVEFAFGLSEENLIEASDGGFRLRERRIPRSVLMLVKRRLGDLSPNCQRFLKVASLWGGSFRLEEVSRMLEQSSASLLSPLDEAIASGFVAADESQLVFESEFLLEGVVESIPAPARDALRREAVCHSRERAEEYGRKSRTTGFSLWASVHSNSPSVCVERKPEGAYSHAHGLIMGGQVVEGIRAAEFILSGIAGSERDRTDAESSLLLGYSLLGTERAERYAEQVLRERSAERGDIAALMALTALSNFRWRAGGLDEALRLGRTAARNGDRADPVWRLHLLLALAGKLASLREFDRAESLVDEAEAGLRELPVPVWGSLVAAVRARLFLQAGRFGDARRQAELAVTAGEPDTASLARPVAYSVLSAIFLYLGDTSTAVEYLKRAKAELVTDEAGLYSVQYAWTDVRIAVKRGGPRAAVELFAGEYRHLPRQRSLYIEDPAAAAFLIRLSLDVRDPGLRHSVLETVDGLAKDNPGIPVLGLSAVHANASAVGDPVALSRIIAQSPDPISVALATEELARIYAAKSPVKRRNAPAPQPDPSEVSPEEVAVPLNTACWAGLSDTERRIAYLVSVGMTNRNIGRHVHLSAHTVNYHLRKIYRKLGINTRVELARGAAGYSSRAAIYSVEEEGDPGTG